MSNRSRRLRRTHETGATLVEMMVSTTIFAVIFAALITGVTSLKRTFTNTATFAGNHATELRISDYIARDLRQALSFSQTGTGTSTVINMTVPNFYNSAGTPRMPTINPDGTVAYQDSGLTPPRTTSTIKYYIVSNTIYRQVDGAARALADGVQDFVIISLDSTQSQNAGSFNLTGTSTRVAQVKVNVSFASKFGMRPTLQTFSNTTLMRNARTDAQTNLY